MRQKHGGSEKKKTHNPRTPVLSIYQTHDTTTCSRTTKKEQKQELKTMGNTEVAMARWTLVVAIFTGLLFFVGAIQLLELYKTNNFNKEALIAIQSPFVFVKNTDFLTSVGPNKEISWRILPIWENSGNTAPHDLVIDIYCHTNAIVVSNPWGFRGTEHISSVRRTLGPKQDTSGGFCQYRSADIIKIQHGDLHLYITSKATYWDKFDPLYMHVTEYCSELVEVTGDANIPPKVVALDNPCATHNCTDDECKNQ